MTTKKLSNKQPGSSSRLSDVRRFLKSNATLFVIGLLIFVVSIYVSIAMLSFFFTGTADQSKIEGISFFHWGSVEGITNWTGIYGAILSNWLMNRGFGISTFFLFLFLILVGLRLMKVMYVNLIRYFIICSLLTIWTSVTLSFLLGGFFKDTAYYIGGAHGDQLSRLIVNNFGVPGTILFIIVLLIVILMMISSRTIPFLQKLFKRKPKIKGENPDKTGNTPLPEEPIKTKNTSPENNPVPDGSKNPDPETRSTNSPSNIPFDVNVPNPDDEVIKFPTPVKIPEVSSDPPKGEENGYNALEELGVYDPTLDLSSYKKPTLDLLKRYNQGETQVDMAEQNENKNKIIQTLENFGISIKSIKATVGPTVTLYEIVPEDGVRIAKIKNLEDDIAMNLAAMKVRIMAPMPGKGTIGIEVPNKDPQIVSMYSIIASKKFQESDYDLPIALGKTITNEVFMIDLTKTPHLLVAGATGQGKSVGLNAAITSLLYKKHPAELKFVLIDPKMVEFSIYSAIEKHFLAKLPDTEKPIITDFTKVIYTLNSLTKEMDDRYELLEKAGSRNVKEYNEKFINRRLNPEKGHRFMPYIVVIIDEFGDLIMTAGKEIEQPIARIAQKARAVGIHMIIATQRPTTNIITGTIKANFPARIAFRVISVIDSRTILDTQGANQLVGRGDMLYTQGSDMTRIQCAFVDTPEVERISKFIGSQQGYPTAHLLPEYSEEKNGNQSGASLSDLDPLFEESARLIVTHQQGSTSLIQRKFSIGYNRAGRIMDQLELAGIVGPIQGSKPRDVYIQDEYRLEQTLNNLKV
ncbi:MAG: DNA translocase FtsK 4TM domain-containing protein [Candidatus Azobacteroides sp.]|nr:DNA translocase FtsK 4TM domain-containing protein [Candidatus Azobacteroides sp.]